MDTTNFHWFAFISTLVYFFILKRYAQKIESRSNSTPKKHSNLIYLLFWPTSLYVFYYMFIYKHGIGIDKNMVYNNSDTTKLMSSPYPNSDSLSLASTK